MDAYKTNKEVVIHTLEGDMKASIGDYIITGVNGEQYPCKPDIFEKTYESVTNTNYDRKQAEIEQWKEEANRYQNLWCIATDDIFKAKSEAVKEFAGKMKNKIKTECNPYGKPTFDYDASISIMRYIDNLVKEMEGENNA